LVGSERTAVRSLREPAGWNLPATILFDIDPRAANRTWPVLIAQVNRRLAQAVGRRSLFHL
jgi:hypothetical protein